MKKTVLAVTAICLAAVLLCGGICFGTVQYGKRQPALAADGGAGALSASALQADPVANKPAQRETLTAAQIYKLACQQVVGIKTEAAGGSNMFGQTISRPVSGTGFIVSEDGYILTNNHVVEGAAKSGFPVTVIFYDGSEYDARIVGVEGDDSDVALLKIDASGLNPVKLGDSDTMQVGEDAYVVGNPLGELTYTMTTGIISALDREISVESNTAISMFQLDAAINSGNSGGPVYNAYGEVIGIVTAKFSSAGVEGLGFAIPIREAQSIAADLKEFGYVPGKPYFGIVVVTLSSSERSRFNLPEGAYVYSVTAGSCAEKAGLKQGDTITALGDVPISSNSDLTIAKKSYQAGDTVDVTVFRAGESLTLTVTFDEMTPEAQNTVPQPTQPIQPPYSEAPEQQPEQESPDSMDDWLNEFFEHFNSFFGESGSEEGEETEEPEKGFRHFG